MFPYQVYKEWVRTLNEIREVYQKTARILGLVQQGKRDHTKMHNGSVPKPTVVKTVNTK